MRYLLHKSNTMSDLADETRQNEEIEALSAIYGDDFLMVNQTEKLFDVRIRHEENSWWSLTIQILQPRNYPSSGPPVFEIHGTWLNDCDEFEIRERLFAISRENKGELVVFQWVEAVREFMNEKAVFHRENNDEKTELDIPKVPDQQISFTSGKDETSMEDKPALTSPTDWPTSNMPEILHGDPITDRKSTFQAHLIRVISEQEVHNALTWLKNTRKIANATHNISAYRIKKDSEIVIQDCDDDGENNAGSRLLHLLQILDVCNYLIVVSRWYGGIHLGPDRFKHINNCARNLLKAAGVIHEKNDAKQEHHYKENKMKRRIKNKH